MSDTPIRVSSDTPDDERLSRASGGPLSIDPHRSIARVRPVVNALGAVTRWAREQPLLSIGLAGIAFLTFCAVFADVLAPRDPLALDRTARLQPPSTDFLMGTDRYGRDILSRVLHGTRLTLTSAFLSVTLAALIGTAIGLVAGYRGRTSDQVLMRSMDVLFAFPALLFAITLAASLGPSTMNASFAIAVIYIPVFARVVRGSVLAEMAREYVDAARVAGARDTRTMLVHVLPNVITPITVQFTMALAAAILLESALSYLGLGTQPPQASWGTLLNEGRVFLTQAPWMSIIPGIVIAGATFLFFLVGDGLRDRLDPSSR